jgi:hypothetical protein
MWRKLFKIFGAKVVATQDHDGAIRYRFASKDSWGDLRCSAIIDFDNSVVLNKDGSCSGKSYVTKWMEV